MFFFVVIKNDPPLLENVFVSFSELYFDAQAQSCTPTCLA
jgi:hypothetical protein